MLGKSIKTIVTGLSVLMCIAYSSSAKSENSDINWQSCQSPQFKSWWSKDDEFDKKLQCATIKVPVDYNNPTGKQIELALAKLPSSGWLSKPIGTLLVIAGGPGENGMGLFSQSGFNTNSVGYKTAHKNFDIIAYAPRGVEPSAPNINCGNLNDRNIVENSERFVKECQTHSDKDLLKNLSVVEASQDIDKIRQALGQEKLSFLAYSYGTFVLHNYAEKYPQHIRAGIFDANFDPSQDYFSFVKKQKQSIQTNFQRFVKYCLTKKNCIFKDEQTADKTFETFILNLKNNKIYDEEGTRIYDDVVYSHFISSLYLQGRWNDTIDLLADIKELDSKQKAIQNNPAIKKVDDNSTNTTDFSDMQKIVRNMRVMNCANFAKPMDKSSFLKHSKDAELVSTFDNFYFDDNKYLDTCFYWPYEGKFIPHLPKVSNQLPQVLFINNRYDAGAPYENAVAMAKAYNSPLITRDKVGHALSLFGTNECIEQTVASYLLDPSAKIESKTCE